MSEEMISVRLPHGLLPGALTHSRVGTSVNPAADITYFTFANEHVYRHGESYPQNVLDGFDGIEHDGRRALGLVDVKKQLLHLGFGDDGLKTNVYAYGDAMRRAVGRAQKAFGVDGDGSSFGYFTTYPLYWCYTGGQLPILPFVQSQKGIPNGYLAKLISLESGLYPSAANTDGDMGLAQEHLPNDVVAAYDSSRAIPWAADNLLANHQKMVDMHTGTWTHQWWAALWAHNAPALAPDWLLSKCATSGGPSILVAGAVWDAWTWATRYVDAVRSQSCLV